MQTNCDELIIISGQIVARRGDGGQPCVDPLNPSYTPVHR